MTITITAKNQITIPASIVEYWGVEKGDKLIVEKEGDSIRITPAEDLIDDLEGSIKLPIRFKGKNIDDIVKMAKKEYFDNKHE